MLSRFDRIPERDGQSDRRTDRIATDFYTVNKAFVIERVTSHAAAGKFVKINVRRITRFTPTRSTGTIVFLDQLLHPMSQGFLTPTLESRDRNKPKHSCDFVQARNISAPKMTHDNVLLSSADQPPSL